MSFFHAAGPYTVFAPTNKAFSLISRSELNGILNDPAKLTKLLQRHVVQDLIYTSGLKGFQKAYALDFEILYIYHAKGELNNLTRNTNNNDDDDKIPLVLCFTF